MGFVWIFVVFVGGLRVFYREGVVSFLFEYVIISSFLEFEDIEFYVKFM